MRAHQPGVAKIQNTGTGSRLIMTATKGISAGEELTYSNLQPNDALWIKWGLYDKDNAVQGGGRGGRKKKGFVSCQLEYSSLRATPTSIQAPSNDYQQQPMLTNAIQFFK